MLILLCFNATGVMEEMTQLGDTVGGPVGYVGGFMVWGGGAFRCRARHRCINRSDSGLLLVMSRLLFMRLSFNISLFSSVQLTKLTGDPVGDYFHLRINT